MLLSDEGREVPSLTWPSVNWSPPKADTQGLIPPVPKAIIISPTDVRALEKNGKEIIMGVAHTTIPYTDVHSSDTP